MQMRAVPLQCMTSHTAHVSNMLQPMQCTFMPHSLMCLTWSFINMFARLHSGSKRTQAATCNIGTKYNLVSKYTSLQLQGQEMNFLLSVPQCHVCAYEAKCQRTTTCKKLCLAWVPSMRIASIPYLHTSKMVPARSSARSVMYKTLWLFECGLDMAVSTGQLVSQQNAC